MNTIIRTLVILVSFLFLWGCNNQGIKREIIDTKTGIETKEIQNNNEKIDITLHWIIASWINIPSNNIYVSGNRLIYNNIFSINIPEEWLSQRDFFNMYWDTLNITDGDLKSLQINKYTLSQNNKCDYNFEEWVKKITKSIKTINWVKFNLANALFEISWPDIVKPINSWQSFLCFMDGENIYKITVSDDKQFRTDIINSFKFLK